jgi:hypothetical protein
MSTHTELEETLSLVEQLCTAEQVKDLLRTRKGEKDVRITAESKEDLVRRNLKTAITAGSVALEKVFDLIRLAEENGDQHIFYYQPHNRKMAEGLTFDSVAKQILGSRWQKQVTQFPTIRLKPSDYRISDFRALTKKPADWVLKVYGHTVITTATGKTEERGNSIWREYVEEPLRIVLIARWNSPDLLEIRVQRDESRRRIEEWKKRIWEILSPALVAGNFDEFEIKHAMKRIILEHEKNKKIYTFRDAAIDDMGVHANFQAYSDQGDLFASQRSIDAIESYLKATGDCKGLTVTWFARPTAAPLEEIKTLLGVRAANEVIFPSHCLPGDMDYVTDQLRSFGKAAS